ncbi:hypothetical protein GGTG_11830 [Gaeumannomyces tritici R3-111a-1]|uniref:Uncharacterized protein n=1 Tax=Gaeumannomyces tritici (strain R3-111a-1) TaxID=644352 RepID=J3PEA7_GAET3|nr:hypothetical protein GGTG_11830 [Gaeumannomyces tritici R3-111a-1]EJT70807.1 hypothetical protein GGTG_11830 [Gaeumannomyces tritici R3-111a-1]
MLGSTSFPSILPFPTPRLSTERHSNSWRNTLDRCHSGAKILPKIAYGSPAERAASGSFTAGETRLAYTQHLHHDWGGIGKRDSMSHAAAPKVLWLVLSSRQPQMRNMLFLLLPVLSRMPRSRPLAEKKLGWYFSVSKLFHCRLLGSARRR